MARLPGSQNPWSSNNPYSNPTNEAAAAAAAAAARFASSTNPTFFPRPTTNTNTTSRPQVPSNLNIHSNFITAPATIYSTTTANTTATTTEPNLAAASANANASAAATASASAAAIAIEKQNRLTEAEKKQNHIASEQKRRAAIREGFDRLTELVPGLTGQGRSESVVLHRSVEFMRAAVEERKKLIEEIERRGGEVPPRLKGEMGAEKE